MKKLILSFFVLIFTGFYVQAQSFQLTWHDEILGDTVIFEGSADTLMVFNPVFKNLLSVDAKIKVVKNDISIVEGAESTFCWGVCFPPDVDSSGVVLVAAGTTTSPDYFTGDYYGVGHPGTSIVKYKFYNVDDVSQYIEVVVKYVAQPNAIDENILRGAQFSAIYPNPAHNYVNLDYTLVPEVKTASIRISNLLGAVVSETNLNVGSSSARINLDQLEGGVYFYSVIVNEERLNTKKLVIR
jgi:hypothetical protein